MPMNQNAYQIAAQMRDYMQQQNTNATNARAAIQSQANAQQPATQSQPYAYGPQINTYLNNLASGFDDYLQNNRSPYERFNKLSDDQMFQQYMQQRINAPVGGK